MRKIIHDVLFEALRELDPRRDAREHLRAAVSLARDLANAVTGADDVRDPNDPDGLPLVVGKKNHRRRAD